MNWILEHLQLVIVVAGALAAWLNQRKKGGRTEEDGENPASTVTGEDDQTRRIQEEIRRKIAERRGQGTVEAPAPSTPPAPEQWAPPVAAPRRVPPVVAPRPVAREAGPSLRDRLEAKLEQVRAREEAA